eukprot:CAMPEP_0202075216 /NCGR_PEP_ID=MMETSP0964-20121228/4078_1 /ASSEMBLY_ACC=CAM_ASM_000500 /TAXON_ID=4773 /ORGANISM="Schizochytrium aggregatum, Strain ATCC28209" /LENGTH=720 /DNA_ID=CAMNT_0048642399 /DNA_START=168 /DNA_END=2330 /DNA_ORIENTATION=+
MEAFLADVAALEDLEQGAQRRGMDAGADHAASSAGTAPSSEPSLAPGEQIGENVERENSIETSAGIAYEAPPSNQMAAFLEDIGALGALGAGPGDAAVGSGSRTDGGPKLHEAASAPTGPAEQLDGAGQYADGGGGGASLLPAATEDDGAPGLSVQVEPLHCNGGSDHGRAPLLDPEKSLLPPVDHSSANYEPFRREFRAEAEPQLAFRWEDIQLNERLLRSLQVAGLQAPTPIQAGAIPAIMRGKDVLAIAETGSGKTLAYLLPMVMHIMDQHEIQPGDGPIGVVLCPTRELGQQIYIQLRRLFKPQGCCAVAVLGGMSKWEQQKVLRAPGCEAIVATPGRLIDVLKLRSTNLRRTTFVALDEADRMLDMGFELQVLSILSQVRPDRQLVLFSATFRETRKMSIVLQNLRHDAIRVSMLTAGETGVVSQAVEQVAVLLNHAQSRLGWLLNMIDDSVQLSDRNFKALVFVAEKSEAHRLRAVLESHRPRLACLEMHGDMQQGDRNAAVAQFRNSETACVLVATDVAARGLHIAGVSHVVCYDPSRNADTHVHRLGRTGRLGGGEGVAFSLVVDGDSRFAVVVSETMLKSGKRVPKPIWDLAMSDARFRRFARTFRHREAKGRIAPDQLLYGAFVKGKHQPDHPAVTPGEFGSIQPLPASHLSREERNALAFTEQERLKAGARRRGTEPSLSTGEPDLSEIDISEGDMRGLPRRRRWDMGS